MSDVLTIFLKCPQEYVLRIFTLSSARDCFQYVLYEIQIFKFNLCHKYDKIHSRMNPIAAFKKKISEQHACFGI